MHSSGLNGDLMGQSMKGQPYNHEYKMILIDADCNMDNEEIRSGNMEGNVNIERV